MKGYTRKELRALLEQLQQKNRLLQYEIIAELDGTLDYYIESSYALPDEYLKHEKHVNWTAYKGERK